MTSEAMSTLSAMFPDVESAVLETVLDSSRGDAAAAVEVLLNMTDEQRTRAPPLSEDVTRATQLAEDEELARQLQQQLLFEEEFNEQQMLYQQQQQLQQQPLRPPTELGYQQNYPGANLGIAPHGNAADMYRPNAWGANAPPAPAQDGGYTVTEALSDAGASVRASASSWYNWAVGDEEAPQRLPWAEAGWEPLWR